MSDQDNEYQHAEKVISELKFDRIEFRELDDSEIIIYLLQDEIVAIFLKSIDEQGTKKDRVLYEQIKEIDNERI